jgi:NAD(P)-dependent dehydrogenase (short-subunit alcohol dehydrogenase family)
MERRGSAELRNVDILSSNVGIFPVGHRLEESSDEEWMRSMAINLDSHFNVLREAIPYLREGFEPVVVFNASKNAIAPGPGVGVYAVAKAGLTQLARVAALELAGDGIRVNVLHPDEVFDTGIWTDDVLKSRADKYGLSVDAYKRRNLLATEIGSDDVARAALALASRSFGKSTGMQVTVDGGNERTV